MKTGNGYSPNAMSRFGGTTKKETSNMVKPNTGKAFSAKKSALPKKKR